MSFYGNIDLGQDYFQEYTLAVVNETSFNDFIDLMKKWKTTSSNKSNQTFKSNSLSKEEYNQAKEYIDIIKSCESNEYAKYKKAFVGLCKMGHILSDGVIIVKYELKEGKGDNDSSLYIEYNYNCKKIQLPEDCKLYHMSKVPDIKELIPQFKGKSERGYLYDKPRIYFTIYKNMPKILADYSPTTKVYYYKAQKEIKEVYVDPLVSLTIQGAIYIQTNRPVPVKEVEGGTISVVKDLVNKLVS